MMDNYQRAEAMLVNYGVLKRVRRELLQELDYINKYGMRNKSKDIVLFEQKASFTLLPIEIKEAFIMRTNRLIAKIDEHNKKLDSTLEALKDDFYFDVIAKYYFLGWTIGKIAFELGKSYRVILKNKKRLVDKLVLIMF